MNTDQDNLAVNQANQAIRETKLPLYTLLMSAVFAAVENRPGATELCKLLVADFQAAGFSPEGYTAWVSQKIAASRGLPDNPPATQPV